MGSLGRQLHIFFFPFLAHGHMIPSVDMAKLFASRGVKTTIITTPLNAPFFSKTIQKTKDSGFDIDIQTIEFPAAEAGLPEGCENTDAFITNEMTKKLIVATTLLQEPFEKVLQERHPDCIVADMFFPWATDAAAKFGIPRLVFHGISNFALCAGECVRLYEPHKQVSSDSEPFVVPNLPGDIIKLTRKQLPASVREDVENDFTKLVKASRESELRSFGVVVNSFYELEPAYADHYRKVLGRRAWNVGPVSLCNRDIEDKSGRGKEASIDQHECLKWLYEPHKQVSSDSEPFVVPNLPGDIIKLTRKQLPASVREDVENDFTKLVKASRESELRSFGVVVNSFYELEPAYADHYRKVLGRRAWNVGPVSLCNRDIEDKSGRGKEASIDQHECLKWLDSKKLNSVVYICFGSLTNFTASQLKEIATGLEASGLQFIWVVRRNKNSEEDKEDWLPEGFEERMEGKGLIIRGWAPQVLILDHEATGAFVTHCGWNSTLEGITAGKPMITWPLFGEQFYNEKLVIDVLRTGVAVGAKEWAGMHADHVTLKSEAIEKAITRIMVGVEADEKRRRASRLGETARKAVEKGGSSFSDVNSLIEELRRHRP